MRLRGGVGHRGDGTVLGVVILPLCATMAYGMCGLAVYVVAYLLSRLGRQHNIGGFVCQGKWPGKKWGRLVSAGRAGSTDGENDACTGARPQ
jgi:hypothetical protein